MHDLEAEMHQNLPISTAEGLSSSNAIVRHTTNYKVVSDDFIYSLFEGTNFGTDINNNIVKMRMLIAKTLRNQIAGYWSGHTIYWIVVNGGFLHDAKTTEDKKLTALGNAYLTEFGGA